MVLIMDSASKSPTVDLLSRKYRRLYIGAIIRTKQLP